MGAKTGLIAYSDVDLVERLRAAPSADPVKTEDLVELVHPGWPRSPAEGSTLFEGTYPPEDIVYAGSFSGVDVVCSRHLMLDRPSELPAPIVEASKGRRLVLHAMHSVVDWLAFAVWEDGLLIRSLSLSPDSGIMENIGEPFPFELPYWAGEHPVEPLEGWPAQGPYPLPFHPLELGEDALEAFFGFVIEGMPDPDELDAEAVELIGFQVSDPDVEAVAARKAEMKAALEAMGPPRMFRLQPDGSVKEINADQW
ncbi:hypothetical protein ABGB12_28145 [Actinocorallia sp. B10E7]|uniref:DUF6928 family protein n=1 Tax=Actinocorallia sp. B10E7 TaxID=3153558 RepID=UPI00325ED009